jgi:tripartite-type tricarboxylate transporter receptor subunit TctC
MKKTIFSLLISMIMTAPVFAQTALFWPFASGSSQAVTLRTIIDNANKSQDKYKFVYENRPGAGGAVAALAMLRSENLALMMSSTSVFTRPMFYPNESYDLDQLEPVMIAAVDQPLIVLSKTISSLQELKSRKEATIGINPGSVTEIVARTLQQSLPNTKLIYVPYPNTIASTTDAAGGHIDMTVDFPKDTIQWVNNGTLKVIGATGTKTHGVFTSFKSQGISSMDRIILNYYVVVKKGTDTKTIDELHNILTTANSTEKMAELWSVDYATPFNKSIKDTVALWNSQKAFWVEQQRLHKK